MIGIVLGDVTDIDLFGDGVKVLYSFCANIASYSEMQADKARTAVEDMLKSDRASQLPRVMMAPKTTTAAGSTRSQSARGGAEGSASVPSSTTASRDAWQAGAHPFFMNEPFGMPPARPSPYSSTSAEASYPYGGLLGSMPGSRSDAASGNCPAAIVPGHVDFDTDGVITLRIGTNASVLRSWGMPCQWMHVYSAFSLCCGAQDPHGAIVKFTKPKLAMLQDVVQDGNVVRRTAQLALSGVCLPLALLCCCMIGSSVGLVCCLVQASLRLGDSMSNMVDITRFELTMPSFQSAPDSTTEFENVRRTGGPVMWVHIAFHCTFQLRLSCVVLGDSAGGAIPLPAHLQRQAEHGAARHAVVHQHHHCAAVHPELVRGCVQSCKAHSWQVTQRESWGHRRHAGPWRRKSQGKAAQVQNHQGVRGGSAVLCCCCRCNDESHPVRLCTATTRLCVTSRLGTRSLTGSSSA